MMIGFVRKLIVIFTLTFASTYANAIEVVKYIANNSGIAEDYYLEVLETALKITEPKYGAYRIDFTHEQLSSERKHDLLIAGERLNIDRIVGFHQPTGRRSALLYINVPLLRGFMGYRIALIRSQSQARFDQVNNLNDLKKISLGLGKGWEGYIYKENGFTVNEPLTFDSLLKMLAGKRYDFVPLSVIEIEDTYDIDPEPIDKLVPEQHY